MAAVYITHHSIDGLNEIVAVNLDLQRAKEVFMSYVDALESTWRKSEEVGKDNTFNRFSEPIDNYLLSADLKRQDVHHSIYLMQFHEE